MNPIPPSSPGWFKAVRGDTGLELLRANRNAFALLYVIAHRARWHDGFNIHGLKLGEAFLGDYHKYGMTQKEYRTAKEFLAKHGFAAFKGTNKGTVATLLDTRVFAIHLAVKGEQNGEQGANEGRAEGEQRATNKDQKKGRSKERINDERITRARAGDPDAAVTPAVNRSSLNRPKGGARKATSRRRKKRPGRYPKRPKRWALYDSWSM